MSDITLSKAVRANLQSLRNTASMMAQTQNTLATGKKVNSALDNPSNFFTASSLNARAGDMNALMDGMANGIQTLEAADNGLKAITKTLESMQSTLRQARQDKSFETASLTVDADTVEGGTAGARTLSFSGGSVGDEAISVNLTNAFGGSITSGADYVAPAASAGPVATADAAYASGTALDVSGGSVTMDIQGTDDAAAITVTIDGAAAADNSAMTLDEVVADINDELSASTSTIRARANADGELELFDSNEANTGADKTIDVTAGATSTALGLTDDATTDRSTTGTDAEEITFSINGTDITLNGDDHADAASAAAAINTQLTADGAAEGLLASADGDRLSIAGPSDGSGITLAGTDVEDAFGASASQVTDQWGAAGNSNGTTKSVDELVSEINSTDGLEGKIRASNDNGKLRIENLSTQELDIDGVGSTGEVDGTSTDSSSIDGNSVRADLATQYNELRDQLDKLADDASFNGVNLLRGDNLQITFNETGTSELNIQTKEGETINSANLGIRTELSAEQLDSDDAIDGFLSEVKTAVNSVRAQSSAFGSSLSIVQNRQDFTSNMMNTLETGAANLTLADSNEEAANLLALQTRQQLSSTALSMASQQDQSVLRLF